MGAQETAAAEVLRAAAAEVSTSSTTRRLRLFRHTLPHLLAKASESSSDTTLFVDLIFQTLPIYDDRASRKAVDDMVIQALGESTFMKPFAATLVQSMEKNLKVTSPLACFKLLRWSCYLLRWSQFAALSKGVFSRLANAQAILCQVLMDGSFRQCRTCKQMFTRLFSESIGAYNMYIEEVRDLKISIRDSPAFLNIILDFTTTSSSLFAEYKSMFLDLYVKTILSSKDRPSQASSEAFKPLFLDMGHEDFKNIVIPSCIRMLKRNPEIVLQSIGYLLKTVRLDLSKYYMEFMPVLLHQARHSVEERRIIALSTVGILSGKSSDPDTLPSMFNAIKAILGGSEGKLSLPYQRIGMINALEQLSRSPPKQISRLAPSLSSFLLTCYKDDGIEEVKLAILSALGSWASVSTETVQPDVVSFIAAGLKEKDTLRKGHLKLIRAICKKSDSLTKYMEENETSDLVQTLLSMGTLPNWCTRHGALLTFCSISMHCSSKLCCSTSFPSIVDLLKDSLKDDKFPVREASTKTLVRLLCYQLQSEASTLQLIQLLVLALHDDSSEVRRRSLSCLKAAAKINTSALATHLSILGPAIAETLNDASTPVRVAAERCALHVFQLTKGADNVTIAQKHLNMTGLEVRKIAKLPEESDGSESSYDDRT